MLSVENPASLSQQAAAASAGLATPFSIGQSAVQMASASGGMGSLAAQASVAGSPPRFSLTPQAASPLQVPASVILNPTIAVPTPFTQAVSPIPSIQPMTATPLMSTIAASSGMSAQAAAASASSPVYQATTVVNPASLSSLNSGMPAATVASFLASPLQSSLPMGSVAQSDLATRMMSPTAEQAEIEMIADRYLAEQGTEEQLVNFFERYKNHRRASTKCALDGRYFYKVLAPYQGLVPSEMYIRINIGGVVTIDKGETLHTISDLREKQSIVTEEEQSGQEFWLGQPVFDLAELAATKSEDKTPRYRLIKLIIDISDDPANNLGSVHSNLIYIDTWKNEIVRFEPMVPSEYTEPINTALEAYFGQSHLLPDYVFRMLPEHPQLPATKTCPSKGMCAAYVLKKAMMLVTDNDRPLNRKHEKEEKKILVFADAIETEYGALPDEVDEREQTGFSISLGSSGPYVSPYYYGDDWLYGPEYYGYRPHHRYARPWGWGWTHGGGHHFNRGWGGGHGGGHGGGRHQHGAEQGFWEDTGRKLDMGWARAKVRAYELEEQVKSAFRRDSMELEGRREAHRQRVEAERIRAGLPPSGELSPEQERELTAARLSAREEMGPGDFNDPKHRQYMANLQRQRHDQLQGKQGWRPIASGGAWAGAGPVVGEKFGAGLVQSRNQYGEETGCGCDGCHMAPPADEYGYWDRDETGKRKWKSVSYAKGSRKPMTTPGPMAMRTQGEAMSARHETGCGCGMKSAQMGAEHGRWNRAEFNQWHQHRQENGGTTTGAVIGGIGGFLVGGPIGAAAGAAAGGGIGYLAGRETGDVLRPSTWQRSTQTAVLGGLLGAGGGYLLGGGTGALLGAGAGGLGGYALGGGFSRPQHGGTPRIAKPGEERISTPPGWPMAPSGHFYVAFPMNDREIIGLVPQNGRPTVHGAPMNFIYEGKTGVYIPHSGRPQYGTSAGRETGNGSTLAGALIGGGAGYFLGGGLSGVVLGGLAGGGAGYLLSRRGRHHRHYYPYRNSYYR